MPRHTFSFPKRVRDAVRGHVDQAVRSIDPRRFKQEPSYTAALAARLQGTAYRGPDGSVVFKSTIVDSLGRNAAESWSGTDLVITAEISDGRRTIRKAILIQAKRGHLDDLSPQNRRRLFGQIDKMRTLTKSPKVMDIPQRGGIANPGIYSGRVLRNGGTPQRYDLGDYFVQRVLTTMDGDTRPGFVDGVQDSGLTILRVVARKDR